MVEHLTIDIGKVSAQTRLGSNVDSWRIHKSTDVTAHHNHSMHIKYDNLSLKFSVESISNQSSNQRPDCRFKRGQKTHIFGGFQR